MMIGAVSRTEAQTQTEMQLLTQGQTKAEAEPPSCGAKLEGGGVPLRFAATLQRRTDLACWTAFTWRSMTAADAETGRSLKSPLPCLAKSPAFRLKRILV